MKNSNSSAHTVFVCGAGHQIIYVGAPCITWIGCESGIVLKRTSKSVDTGTIHCSGIVNGDAKIGHSAISVKQYRIL